MGLGSETPVSLPSPFRLPPSPFFLPAIVEDAVARIIEFSRLASIRLLTQERGRSRRDRRSMRSWFGNIFTAVATVIQALWVTMRYWVITYDPRRRTFTEQYEFPELPLKVAARYRGFHRFDLTTCIACDACARACPANCIYIGKQRVAGRKGFQVTSFTIDYGKCLFCALCIDPCPVDCIFMGSSHDLSCYRREGCLVDFSRLPVEIAWGRATLDPLAVARSKSVQRPVHGGPNA